MPRHPRFDKEESFVKYVLWRGKIDKEFRKTKIYKQILGYKIFQALSGIFVVVALAWVIYLGARGQ